MPSWRAASASVPVSAIAASRSALPGPMAISSPCRTRMRGRTRLRPPGGEAEEVMPGPMLPRSEERLCYLLGSARVTFRIRSTRLVATVALAVGLLVADPLAAGEVHVAVAANFAPVLERLAAEFERATGHRVLASPGSTGKLFAQIENGAPFEVFLSADVERPQKLEASGAAVAGSRFTYALGKLVLWSPRPGMVDGRGRV